MLLSLFNGTHCGAKNLLKMFAFFLKCLTRVLTIWGGGISGIFFTIIKGF